MALCDRVKQGVIYVRILFKWLADQKVRMKKKTLLKVRTLGRPIITNVLEEHRTKNETLL